MTPLKTCPQCSTSYDSELKFCPRDGSALRTPAGGDALVGQVIAERYHVLRKIGEGGMGQVFLAEHVKMGRRSAIKVIRASMVSDVDAIGRFNREAANASRISHPNVAAIYDFGETADGLIYLAMEYVDGEPLSQLLERERTLSPVRAVSIAEQVASALDAAHDRGIVHRDLKPDNIMIARGRDGRDLVKVVDFGIAKATDGGSQKVTRTGMIIGTPEYMSPEQLAGDDLDGRSDTYALALVLFHALTGTHAFPSESAQEVMIARLTERPRSLAEASPRGRWPAALQSALDRALARKASDRFARAGDLAAALKAAVHGDGANSEMPPNAGGSGMVYDDGPVDTTAVRPTGAAPGPVATLALPRTVARGAGTRVLEPGKASRRSRRAVLLVTLLALGGGAAAAVAWRSAHAADPVGAARPVASSMGSRTAGEPHPEQSAARPQATLQPRWSAPGDAPPLAETRSPGVREQPSGSGAALEPRAISSRRERQEERSRRTARERSSQSPDSANPAAPSRASGAEAEITGASELLQRAVELGQVEAIVQVQHRLARALPNLRSRSDSVRAQYHLAEALIANGQEGRACALLRDIKDDAGQFRRAALVHYDRYCR